MGFKDGCLLFWELPQSLLGLVLCVGLRARGRVRGLLWERGRLFVELDGPPFVSLGGFIFWAPVGGVQPLRICQHEYGHSFPSRAFGPLYLFVVGLPSVSRVAYSSGYRWVTGRAWGGCFDGWPERQAEVLGGVIREAE